MHLDLYIYQIKTFESYFGLFICLKKEISSKLKKTSRRDKFNFFAFFHVQSYMIFEKCIQNHFHIQFKDLKAILDFSLSYKRKKVQIKKKVAPGQFQFFCFFSCPILSNIWKMHFESFSYQMWRFESYFRLFICS